MSISIIRMVPAAILIVLGILIMTVQVWGVFRLHYVLNRIHAAAMGDSLGIFLIVLGLMVLYGISFSSLKLMFVLLLFWSASPVCSHLIGKLETFIYKDLAEECELPEDESFQQNLVLPREVSFLGDGLAAGDETFLKDAVRRREQDMEGQDV